MTDTSNAPATTNSETRSVQAGRVQLAYRTWGGGEGVPVVLLHALGEDGEDWRGPLLSHLSAEHRLYAPDLTGHGASDWPGTYGLEQQRDDLAAFLDALALDRVVLVGHSYGSILAYLLAQEQPSRVARLVLEEPAPMRPLAAPPEVPERPAGRLLFDWEVKIQFMQERNSPKPDWWERLAGITSPALLVAGGPESHLSQRDMELMAERMPDARMVTVEGGGHLVHEERPLEFAATVGAFLAE